jgi:dipeptidyl aminopeptidase/acylaminoacyl peptidase
MNDFLLRSLLPTNVQRPTANDILDAYHLKQGVRNYTFNSKSEEAEVVPFRQSLFGIVSSCKLFYMKNWKYILALLAVIVLAGCRKEVNDEPVVPTTQKFLVVTMLNSATNTFMVMSIKTDGSGGGPLVNREFVNNNYNNIPGISADGKKLVYVSNDSIYVMTVSNGNSEFIYKNKNTVRYPVLNKNGTKIAFASIGMGQTNGSNLFVVDAVANSQAVQITDFATDWWAGTMPAFSPDGQKIAFGVGYNADDAIYMSNLDGSSLIRVSEEHGFGNADGYPVFSPASSKLVFSSSRYNSVYPGVFDLVLADAVAGGETTCTRLTTMSGSNAQYPFYPAFSVDGNSIYFTAQLNNAPGSAWNIYKIPVGGGTPVNLTNATSTQYRPFNLKEIEKTTTGS